MNPPRSCRQRQKGIVTIWAVIFLIVGVIITLTQSLIMSGTSGLSNTQQMDSTAALFLAESGLERGQKVVASASPITNTTCMGIGAGPFSLGRGNFTLAGTSYAEGTTLPNTFCDSTGTPTCKSCVLQSTGNIPLNPPYSSSRTIERTISLTTVNGTTCNHLTAVPNCSNLTAPPPTWSLALKNTYPNTAVALMHLAATRQGNPTGAGCTGLSNCILQWNINSQNGNNSVLSMGNLYTIAGLGTSQTVYQTVSSSQPEDVAEVGVLFPGTSTPSLVGAYWDDTNPGGGGTKTVGKTNDSTGQTNNGTATYSGTCNFLAPGTSQSCTNWCYGGDTLVFGFAGGSSTGLIDSLSSVLFNTSGSSAQNIQLTRLSHFPTSLIPGAPSTIYSEIWLARNPDYLSNATATSGGVVTGSIGVSSFAATLTSGSAVMDVTSLSGILHVGDSVSCTTGGSCPSFLPATIQPGGTPCGAGMLSCGLTGNYTLSANSNCSGGNCTRNFQTNSAYLDISTITNGYLSIGDNITSAGGGTNIIAGTTITSIVGLGNESGSYGISTTQQVSSRTVTANGTTIHVNGGTVPETGIPAANTILAVRAGPGLFAANTTVLATPPPTPTLFKVSAVPSTRLSAATICGGTCAFFDQASATTNFSIGKPDNTDYWASGFMCLSGVDIAPTPVTSSTAQATTWREVVK